MIYSEAAYFDGNHCAHVAAYHEALRLAWLKRRTDAAMNARGWKRLVEGRN